MQTPTKREEENSSGSEILVNQEESDNKQELV
jgi:hypothetical protein